MIQEYAVHGLAHHIIAPEREGHIAHSTAYFSEWHTLLDDACRFYEIDTVIIMLFYTRGYRKYVGVKNYILWRKAHLLCKYLVGTLAYVYFALQAVCLSYFIKCHYDHRCAVAAAYLGLLYEFLLPFLHRYGVDDTLTLYALQARFYYRELRRVEHDGYAGNIRLGLQQVYKSVHGQYAVQQRIVHVDVQYLRAALHLLAGYRKGFLVFILPDEAREFFGAGNISTLPHIHKIRLGPHHERLQSAQSKERFYFRHSSYLNSVQR